MKNNALFFLTIMLFSILTFSSCKEDPVVGCTNPDAENYDPNADEDSGECIIKGCTNPDAENYNADATQDDGSCIIKGCTDENAINYDADATEDDGSCMYRKDAFLGEFKGSADCDDATLNDIIGGQEITFRIVEIEGEHDKVTVELDFEVDIVDENPIGTIDENNVLTFKAEKKNFEIEILGSKQMVDVTIDGTFTLDETMNVLSGPLEVLVVLPITTPPTPLIQSTCNASATRQ